MDHSVSDGSHARSAGLTMRIVGAVAALMLPLLQGAASAQGIPNARLAILLAEERSAKEPRDLATLRMGLRNRDGETARTAVRALGRLRRPALATDIAVGFESAFPEVRAEAANALAQALSGTPVPPAAVVETVFGVLRDGLDEETEAHVRSTLLGAIGRLPYADRRQIENAEGTLLSFARSDFVMDRLGVAKGLETLVRKHAAQWQPGPATVLALRRLLGVAELEPQQGAEGPAASDRPAELAHDARVRRLAVEALMAARAVDPLVVSRAAGDFDPQVRRLGLMAAAQLHDSAVALSETLYRAALADASVAVRLEALRGIQIRQRGSAESCQASVDATHDVESKVAVAAFEYLGDCGAFPGLPAYLEQAASPRPDAESGRAWVRAGYALEALARVAPERAAPLVRENSVSPLPQLRLHAVRAAALLGDRVLLEQLAADETATVSAAAGKALGRSEQPSSARDTKRTNGGPSDLNATDLRRLGAARARVTVRGLGAFDLVLITTEAPAAVLRFVRLVEGGFFEGLTIGAGAPTLVHVSSAEAAVGSATGRTLGSSHNEAGVWPHVRGTMGLSPDGTGTGGAQVFLNLVDNPRFDHELTVFAQVLHGFDVVDRVLEGDVIERIDILP
jgi:peptidyl-prolyl cis-trans isomerase B (cyclophilin B)